MRLLSFPPMLLAIALLGPGPAASASASNQRGPDAIPESAAGLQAQLEGILGAVRNHDARYEDLISDLRIPEGTDWFAATFGEEVGSTVAANYERSWAAYKEQIVWIFQNTSKARLTEVDVKPYSATSPPTQDSFLQAVLKDAKTAAIFYTAVAVKGRKSSVLPGVYVYVRGAFRIVNWAAFYGLPNVRPIRIRVSTSVAMSQLVHQVNPAMSEDARRQDLQGHVVLHIVIDRDGDVAQAQPVSGPELLAKAAIEAVRQWHFKPTVLNGDSVEVDTTVEFFFSTSQ